MAEEKAKLTDEELDRVTGGNMDDCEKLRNKLGTCDPARLTELAQLAFGTKRVSLHIDSRRSGGLQGNCGNGYVVRGKMIDQDVFIATIKNYLETHKS